MSGQNPPESQRRKRGRPRVHATPADTYRASRESTTTAIKEASRQARDIAPAPEIVDRKRRDEATADLLFFLKTYFPRTFRLPFCSDHAAVIDRLQTVIESGGQYALAMPRGHGKTSLLERASLWSILTGRRKFAVLVSANEVLAEQSLGRLKSELEHSELLLADWPKAVHPLRRLESQSRRAVGQLYEGVRTEIVWQRKGLVMLTVPGPDNEASVRFYMHAV